MSLSGAMRMAAKGRLPRETARRCTSRQAWRFLVICAAVEGLRGGKRVGWAAWAAVKVRASVGLSVALSSIAILKSLT